MSDPNGNWLLEHLPDPVAAALIGAVGWWVQRKLARAEALEARIAALERDKVTKGDIEDLRESNNDAITRGFARVESRTDEILLHLAQERDR